MRYDVSKFKNEVCKEGTEERNAPLRLPQFYSVSLSFATGFLPKISKNAFGQPIPKRGNKSLSANYRPIT